MKLTLTLTLTLILRLSAGAQTLLPDPSTPTTKAINSALSGAIAVSGTNTYTASLTGLTTYTGFAADFQFTNANTSTTTSINITGSTVLGAKSLKKYFSGSLVDLDVGDISAGGRIRFYYNGTYLVMIGVSAVNDSDIVLNPVTTNDVSDIQHGFMPALSDDPTIFYAGDGTQIPILSEGIGTFTQGELVAFNSDGHLAATSMFSNGGGLIMGKTTQSGSSRASVAQGSASNIDLQFRPKGTGNFDVTNNVAGSGTLRYNSTTNTLSCIVSSATVGNYVKGFSGSATLDFGSTSSLGVTTLTITVTGAADGDIVDIGVPNAAFTAGLVFTGRVSTSNTVSIQCYNSTGSSIDPASGTFKVQVFK